MSGKVNLLETVPTADEPAPVTSEAILSRRGRERVRDVALSRSLVRGGLSTRSIVSALAIAGTALIVCASVAAYAAWAAPTAIDRLILSSVLLLPAIFLSAARSPLLLDHFLILVVTNRLLRRLLDWGEGRFDDFPVLSLVPLVVALLMIPTIVSRWRVLNQVLRRAVIIIACSFAYSTAIGFRTGAAAIYALAEYATPLIVLLFCVACKPTIQLLERWISTLVALGILVAVYGFVQWSIVPPWDAAWLRWSGMSSSMGDALPFRMSIASTLESRGPASMFFATVATLFIALPPLRRSGGFVWASVLAFALLLTQARTGVAYLVIAVLATTMLGRRRSGWKALLAMFVVGTLTMVVLSYQRHGDVIANRVATLGEIGSDNSARGRVDIARDGVLNVLTNPFGYGFGAGGNAVRAGSGRQQSVGDNGYLEIVSTMGIPGALLYGWGMFLIARLAFARDRHRSRNDVESATLVGRGLLVAFVPALVIGNCLIGFHASYVWMLLSRHIACLPREKNAKAPLAPHELVDQVPLSLRMTKPHDA